MKETIVDELKFNNKYKHSLQAVNYHFWPCELKHLPADPKANFHACDVTVVTAYFLVSAMNMLGMRA